MGGLAVNSHFFTGIGFGFHHSDSIILAVEQTYLNPFIKARKGFYRIGISQKRISIAGIVLLCMLLFGFRNVQWQVW